MMAVTMPFRSRVGRVALALAVVLVWLAAAAASWAQAPPPRPKPRPEGETQQTPPPRPPRRVETGPPPPELLVSSDMACRLELDGELIGELQKDIVARFILAEGDHLLQAFPLGIDGPTWKKPISVPATGTVAETIELAKLVAEWSESDKDKDRFEVLERTVIDHDTQLAWARNVSPQMTWDQVLGYCAGRDLDGALGWRLPVLDELSTLQFEDHESPRQEMDPGERKWTIFGPRREDTEVLPRLIQPAFDHNSVAALWIDGDLERTACTFLGGFGCEVFRKKKEQAAVLCVRSLAVDGVAEVEEPGGRR